jgi:aryl-alcohol dehydrogenase-like predicted oxidoreductase
MLMPASLPIAAAPANPKPPPGSAQRSGAQSGATRRRQLQPDRRPLEIKSFIYVSTKCLRSGSHSIPRNSKKVGVSPAQVALAWLRYASVPIIPIIGAKKLVQLQDNLASAGVQLAADDLKLLNEASAITLGFPNNFYAKPRINSMVYGGLRDRIKV